MEILQHFRVCEWNHLDRDPRLELEKNEQAHEMGAHQSHVSTKGLDVFPVIRDEDKSAGPPVSRTSHAGQERT